MQSILQILRGFYTRVRDTTTGGVARASSSASAAVASTRARFQSMQRNGHDESNTNGQANDDEEDDELPDMAAMRSKMNTKRRQSVSAESYDPAKDDEAEKRLPVYPKNESEMSTLREAMSKALIFRSLEPTQLKKVADAVRPALFKAGDVVIREGDEEADDFYVIENGVLGIYKNINGEDKLLGTYDNSGAFGELALLYNQPRAATIKCQTDSKLWALDRQTFQVIVVRAAYKKRQLYMEIMDKVDFLSELTSYERQNLCDALQPRYFGDKQAVLRQGDKADGMYFIEEGKCRVVRRSASTAFSSEAASPMSPTFDTDSINGERELTVLNRGDYFGELALLTNKPRAATVIADDGPIKLAFLDTAAFERVCGPCLEIMKRNIGKYEKQLDDLGIKASLS